MPSTHSSHKPSVTAADSSKDPYTRSTPKWVPVPGSLKTSSAWNRTKTIFFGGMDYKWQFSETAAFEQTFVLEAGEDNTFLESKSSVSATLVGALSLVASYTVRNNSDVPAGTEKTDTQTAISLEYGF